MKRVKMFNTIKEFETFINRSDIDIISVDIKVVEQSFIFQEGFSAIVFYQEPIKKN